MTVRVLAAAILFLAGPSFAAPVVEATFQESSPSSGSVPFIDMQVDVPSGCVDCILVVSVSLFTQPQKTLQSASLGGDPLTIGPSGFAQVDNLAVRSYVAWLRGPPSGLNTLTLSASDSVNFAVVASVISGLVDQEPIYYGTNGLSGSSISVGMEAQAGALIVDALSVRGPIADASAVTSPSRTVTGTEERSFSNPAYASFVSQSIMPASGFDTVGWTFSQNRQAALSAVAFLAADSPLVCPFSWTPTDEVIRDLPKVLDLRADFGAECDGVTDDSPAFAQVSQLNPGGIFGGFPTVTVPEGTCLVTDRVWLPVYTALRGAGVDKTTIRLAPGSFTDPQNPRAVVQTNCLTSVGNDCFRNHVKHLTVSVGPGNPGANGIDFAASNVASVENVRVVFEDGQGFAGLDSRRDFPGSALVSRLEVIGGSYGVRLAKDIYSLTGAGWSLTGQSLAAVENADNTLLIHGLKTDTLAPASISSGRALTTILGAELRDGDPGELAAQGTGQHLVRRIAYSGYSGVLTPDPGMCLFEQATSAPLMAFAGSSPVTMALPWVDPPEMFTTDNPDHWTYIGDYPGDADVAFRNALYSRRPFVAMDGGASLPGTYSVPEWVRTIHGHNGSFVGDGDGAIFVVDEPSSEPLTIAAMHTTPESGQLALWLKAPRPVVLRDVQLARTGVIRVESGAGPLWLVDVLAGELYIEPGAKVYALQLNMEGANAEKGGVLIKNNGGQLVAHGFKHESRVALAKTTNGGCTEMLGVSAYMVSPNPQTPMFIVEDASMTVSYNETAFTADRAYQTILVETRNGVTQTLEKADVPQRGWGSQGVLVSAYTGSGCPL